MIEFDQAQKSCWYTSYKPDATVACFFEVGFHVGEAEDMIFESRHKVSHKRYENPYSNYDSSSISHCHPYCFILMGRIKAQIECFYFLQQTTAVPIYDSLLSASPPSAYSGAPHSIGIILT